MSSSKNQVAPPVRWHGALEGMHDGLLYGWALDAEQPASRVVLEILLDDQLLCCVAADVARSDLAGQYAALNADDACHGLVADLTAHAGQQQGWLSARVANTGVLLAGRLAYAAPPAPPAPALSKVSGDGALRLHGWVRDPAQHARQLTVHAYVGQQRVAQARADISDPYHPEVGAHSFRLDLPLSLADGRQHSVRVADQDGQPLNGSPVTLCCMPDGLLALLPPPTTPQLAQVIDAYQARLPRSLAWSGYAAWTAHFDRADASPALPPAGTAQRIGLLISGDDHAAIARSAASAADPRLDIRTYAGQPLAALLQQARGDGCTLLACVRGGDALAPHALAWALQGLALPAAQLVYGDSEYAGRPWFKPAWNPDYALASDYPLELMLWRASLLDGLTEPPHDAAQLSWQVLAQLWPQGQQAIVHVPRVLYHYATPLDAAERSAREQAATAALHTLEPQAQLHPLRAPADAGIQAARRLQLPLSDAGRAPPVSLIIPTRDRVELLQRCLDSLRRHTAWPQMEIIIIDNGSVQPATLRYLRQQERQGVRVLRCPGPFNFAALNNQAVTQASGAIVGLINNDIEALHDGWLDEMVSQLLRPGIGAVGAKLLWPNGMVQHGGVLLGVGYAAGHYGHHLADADWGDHGRNQLAQQVSGVTAACMLLRRADYLALGGMDQQAFPVAFNDVDLCLKLRRAGLAIVWTPHARLLHAESASRGKEDTPQKQARAQREMDLLRQRWGACLLDDPCYHPSLNLDPYTAPFGGLALPPRPRQPRSGSLSSTEQP